jgi:hypothetical protein
VEICNLYYLYIVLNISCVSVFYLGPITNEEAKPAPDSFLAKIMEGKYFSGSNILEANLGARPSFAVSIARAIYLELA